jgi:hypothetical protein
MNLVKHENYHNIHEAKIVGINCLTSFEEQLKITTCLRQRQANLIIF